MAHSGRDGYRHIRLAAGSGRGARRPARSRLGDGNRQCLRTQAAGQRRRRRAARGARPLSPPVGRERRAVAVRRQEAQAFRAVPSRSRAHRAQRAALARPPRSRLVRRSGARQAGPRRDRRHQPAHQGADPHGARAPRRDPRRGRLRAHGGRPAHAHPGCHRAAEPRPGGRDHPQRRWRRRRWPDPLAPLRPGAVPADELPAPAEVPRHRLRPRARHRPRQAQQRTGGRLRRRASVRGGSQRSASRTVHPGREGRPGVR